MDKHNSSKSSLFLMELIIVILFFSICAAICIQVFASAKQLADNSYQLHCAVLAAQSGAETYKATAGDLSAITEVLNGEQHGTGTAAVYYDESWQRLSPEDNEQAAYIMSITAEEQEALVQVSRLSDGDELYQIPVMAHGGGKSLE